MRGGVLPNGRVHTCGRVIMRTTDARAASTPDFWLLAVALRAFIAAEGGGCLPLDGALPDMASSTDAYVQLQRIFAAKASADVDALEQHVVRLLRLAGRAPGAITRDAVKLFAKNAASLAVVRTQSLAAELSGAPGERGAALCRALAAEDSSRSNTALFILLRAADRFSSSYGRFPGVSEGEVEEDAARLKACAASLLGAFSFHLIVYFYVY